MLPPTSSPSDNARPLHASGSGAPDGKLLTSALTASYRYWDGGIAMGNFIAMTTKADFFANNSWARGAFFAVEGVAAVPEPGVLTLLLGGVLALAASTQRYRPDGRQ